MIFTLKAAHCEGAKPARELISKRHRELHKSFLASRAGLFTFEPSETIAFGLRPF